MSLPTVIAKAVARVKTEDTGKIFEMARAEYPIMGKILKEAGVQAE